MYSTMTKQEEALYAHFGEKWVMKLEQMFKEHHYIGLRNKVNRIYATGQVVPESKDIFRAFRMVDPDDVKVIIIGQDPYPTTHANGIAFATDKAELPTSLELILQQVEKTTGRCTQDYTLKEWCDQGVLLLNCRLTTRLFQPGHQDHRAIGWESFILRVLDVIVKTNRVAIVGMGKETKGLLTPVRPRYVTIGNYVGATEHPAAANYNNREWECKNIFNKVNKFLVHNNMEEIEW